MSQNWGKKKNVLKQYFISAFFQNCYCNIRTEELVVPKSGT